MILQDFSFTSPEELMENIEHEDGHGGMGHGAMGHGNGAMGSMMGGSGMGHGNGGHGGIGNGASDHDMGDHGEMPGMEMDLNDIDFDAYLANDRTLADPEVVRVERGGRVKLRLINAAAATVFWIDTDAVAGRLCEAKPGLERKTVDLSATSGDL